MMLDFGTFWPLMTTGWIWGGDASQDAQKVFLIAKINRWNNSFHNMYDMLYAKVDRLAGKTYFIQKKHLKTPRIMDNFSSRVLEAKPMTPGQLLCPPPENFGV